MNTYSHSRAALVALAVVATAIAAALPVGAATSVYLSPEDLAASAPLVIEGTVQETASGFDPDTGSLATYVTLEVDHVHRGPELLEEIVLLEPGGSYGGLVHEVDAVPAYEPGERVLVFLEMAPDGAPRTAGMFFGKFRIQEEPHGGESAARDLAGQGTIVGNPVSSDMESFPLGDLSAVVRSIPLRGVDAFATAAESVTADEQRTRRPPEFDRLQWQDIRQAPDTTASNPGTLSRLGGDVGSTEFVALSTSNPSRWHQSDSALAIVIDVERAGNPLADGPAAAFEIGRALAAWTDVPEAMIQIVIGDDDADFTNSNAQGPNEAYPPNNIVLFDDPYGSISDPSGCGGVLAIGGYWRTSSPQVLLNNETFYPILKQYVIFNNGFECFLGDPDNLAEVATHEIGHGLGFGHSTVADAIMRSSAYGNRGPVLGDDDRDIAHCHYPHFFDFTSPDGGESWDVGSSQQISWDATTEAGPDAGLVDLELSVDGGANWISLSTGEANDGSYPWTIPDLSTGQARVRVVRHNLVSPTPAPYPTACSSDASVSNFSIVAPAPPAGTVPDGSGGAPLTVNHAPGGDVTLSWGASCSAGAADYAIYEGSLDALRLGSWDHAPLSCAAGTDLVETVTPGAGLRYYLVAPSSGTFEGGMGRNSSGVERPASGVACLPREAASCS